MKVLALNGSPHAKGNTFTLLSMVAAELKKKKIGTEIVQLGKAKFGPCTVCLKCKKEKDGHCHGVKDKLNPLIDKMAKADALLLGSPVWFSAATPYLKNVLDRAGFVSRQGDPLFQRKPGAAVIAVRRCGANPTFSELNYWMLINEMIVVGSSYWNMAFGAAPGDVKKDEEGVLTMKTLADNLAWTMKKLK